MEDLLEPHTVGDALKVSLGTLRLWRATGRGPAFVKVGRQVRYRPSAVEAWLAAAEQPTGEQA